jgi:hypothetical protein
MITVNETIQTEIKGQITLCPEDIARIWCAMDMNQQAKFFATIHTIVETEWKAPLPMQLESVTRSIYMTDGAREVMQQIGDYAAKPRL